MSFEISGKITEVFQTQQVTDKFKKREFILEVKESSTSGFEFVEYIKFQAVQDKCSLLDGLNPDDQVKVYFNLRGRKWEKDGQTSYFTNLDAWKIENERSTSMNPNGPGMQEKPGDVSDDPVPFPQDPPADDSGFDDLPF
jgi:single-strand DNA-binding protein